MHTYIHTYIHTYVSPGSFTLNPRVWHVGKDMNEFVNTVADFINLQPASCNVRFRVLGYGI